MAPQDQPHTPNSVDRLAHSHNGAYPRKPLELSGALQGFRFEETTPTIGREYLDVDIVNDILNSENADALIRDLAITSE
jgi:hypothetical protein